MSLVNVLLVRHEGGTVEVTDAASIAANGRAEAYLEQGGVQSDTEATVVAQAVMDLTAVSRVASVAEIEPATNAQTPYLGFEPYDSVRLTQPGGALGTVKVRAVTCEVDDWRQPAWTIEAANQATVEAQQFETWLRRQASGFLSGSTETANPASPSSPIESGEVRAKEWRASKSGVLSSGDLSSQKERLGTVAHLCLFLVTLTTAATSGTTTVVLKVSGTTVATVSIAAGSNTGWTAIAHHLVNGTDTLQATITTAGTGAEGLVATARYI